MDSADRMEPVVLGVENGLVYLDCLHESYTRRNSYTLYESKGGAAVNTSKIPEYGNCDIIGATYL